MSKLVTQVVTQVVTEVTKSWQHGVAELHTFYTIGILEQVLDDKLTISIVLHHVFDGVLLK